MVFAYDCCVIAMRLRPRYAHDIEDVLTAYIPFLTGILLTSAHFHFIFCWFFCKLTEARPCTQYPHPPSSVPCTPLPALPSALLPTRRICDGCVLASGVSGAEDEPCEETHVCWSAKNRAQMKRMESVVGGGW